MQCDLSSALTIRADDLFFFPMKVLTTLLIVLALTLIVFFAMKLPTHAQAPTQTPTSTRPFPTRSAPAITTTIYFPLITNFLPDPCAAIPNQTYGSVAIVGSATDRPAAQHADMNLALRGYTITVQSKRLVNYGGASDLNAPQFANLFSPARLPAFVNTYQVGKWDWGCNCNIGWDDQWDVELLGTGTSPAEIISAPASGYDIGLRPTGGYEVMVLYATNQQITFTYGRYDSIVNPQGNGYAIHVENICVEPSLLALYNSLNTQGRSRLPALFANQPFGRARGSEIQIAIRDSGMFMDPRSRNDWWQ